jgi:cysteinyl-tRNA synthetase
MPLTIYNTLTRKKEEFVPIVPGEAGIYVCGPTVYGHSHVGHAKSYVSFDIIVRYLRFLGLRVRYVQNITDVGHLTDDADEGEDKIEKQSRKDRVHPMQVAEEYTRSYFRDMDALNVLRADISPRASGHIVEQISMVKGLIDRGYAYEVNGSVYFDVSKDPDYGKLSNRIAAEAEAGTRVSVKSEKRHPSDFALWKKAEPGHIMQWPSPWGVGFPGWHVECSAMSMKYLGGTFDIHGGGMDNMFPHHECEIAQSECLTGKPFVRYWIHNNLVTVGGQKMGKSLGNVILLKDAFVKRPPLVMRFFILQSHYRGTLDFTEEAMDAAAKGHEKILNTMRNLETALGAAPASGQMVKPKADGPSAPYRARLLEAMDDDFNTPQAIAVLFDAAREVNTLLAADAKNVPALRDFSAFFGETADCLLGIVPAAGPAAAGSPVEPQLLDLLVELRADVRKEKLWGLSDKIRDALQKLGVTLEDKKGGTNWRRS